MSGVPNSKKKHYRASRCSDTDSLSEFCSGRKSQRREDRKWRRVHEDMDNRRRSLIEYYKPPLPQVTTPTPTPSVRYYFIKAVKKLCSCRIIYSLKSMNRSHKNNLPNEKEELTIACRKCIYNIHIPFFGYSPKDISTTVDVTTVIIIIL